MSNFKIGEKVVCVDDSVGQNSGLKKLKLKEIYTIDGIYISVAGNTAFYLKEVESNYCEFWQKKIGFNSSRFRKLDHQFAEDLCKELNDEWNAVPNEFVEAMVALQ